MRRSTLALRLFLIVAALSGLAVFVGGLPWGPG